MGKGRGRGTYDPFFSFATLAYARVARLDRKKRKKRNKEKLQNPNYCKKNESSLECLEKPEKNAKRHLLDLIYMDIKMMIFFFFWFFFSS